MSCVVSRRNFQHKHQLSGVTEEQGHCIGNNLEILFWQLAMDRVYVTQEKLGFTAIIMWKHSNINTLKVCFFLRDSIHYWLLPGDSTVEGKRECEAYKPVLMLYPKFISSCIKCQMWKVHVGLNNYFIEYDIPVTIPKCCATVNTALCSKCEDWVISTTLLLYQLVVHSVAPSWRELSKTLCKVCKHQYQ